MRISHHGHDRHPDQRYGHERGYIIAMLGLLLVPLLLMVGLSVDVGYWYNRASEVQKAADAAALAGVVFLPNVDDAERHARTAAASNGFDYEADDVTVSAVPAGERRLRVTVTEHRVGSFFFASVGGRSLDISRSATAQYVEPVPLGSPRNFFGLGTLLREYGGTGFTPEYLYQSVNPYCTDKVNGDRHQSFYDGNTCANSSGRTLNPEYDPDGYAVYIDVLPGRPAPIDVMLFDPRYNVASVPVSGCTEYVGSWTGPVSGSTQVTINGPVQYQTRPSSSGSSWSATVTLEPGQNFRHRRDRLRYQYPSECASPGVDSRISTSGPMTETYTFSLYAADDTPFDDTDNPLICQEDYVSSTAFDGYVYLGSPRWNTLCTIDDDPEVPTGKYILRVTNGGEVTSPMANGANNWGLVARYTNASSHGLCDGRSDGECPRVYGKDTISVMAAADTDVASFFLAEIEPSHSGKTLRLELFDPGEGGRTIEIMRPTGTDGNSWEPARFSWSAPGEGSGTNVSSVEVRVSEGSPPRWRDRFNGKVLTIDVDLSDYSPPENNEWWQIRYTFAGADVTDRTTWSATVLGDPVHLVEED